MGARVTTSTPEAWITKPPLPRRLASYIARSAALSNSSAVIPSRGADARPMLAPTRAVEANSNGSETRNDPPGDSSGFAVCNVGQQDDKFVAANAAHEI